MKALLGQTVVALLLCAVGIALWTGGQLERRVADAHQQLLMLHYQLAVSEYSGVEQLMRHAALVPWLTERMLTDIREHRGRALYWLGNYDELALGRDASGTLIEDDPEILLLAANAAYRESRSASDGEAAVPRLSEALKIYAEVLKRDPGNADAAYNFEYVARTRDRLAKVPRVPPGATGSTPRATIHGRSGGVPVQTGRGEFNVLTPKRQDERTLESEASQGQKRVRKG